MRLLEVDKVAAGYDKSIVIHGISMKVNAGEVVALLGRNGAGKTTTLRCIMGLTPPRTGSIKFKGIEIAGKKPFEIARLGIGYVPDDRRIFPDLTVEENLEIAGRLTRKTNKMWTVQRVYQLFPFLEKLRLSRGGCLSGGEQKMLAIGRALMKDPELLLLDEPSEGLGPLIVRELIRAIKQIKEAGVAILVADQNVRFCRQVADRGYIISRGSIVYEGTLEEIWRSEEVLRKYLAV